MVDHNAVGAEGAAYVLDVERGKIREFARAVMADDPAYLAEDEDRPTIPPTFLTTTFLWEGREGNPWIEVGMDVSRGLHAEQEYVFHGPPPRAGTRLTCRSRISEIYEKEGKRGGAMTFVKMLTEFRDPDGRLVAEATMTGVETAKPPTGGGI